MFALKREQRGAPAVVEAVRQRCSHIAATKAYQVFDVICSQGRLRDVHVPCGCLTCTATDARKLLLTQPFTCIAAVSCRTMSVKQFAALQLGGGGEATWVGAGTMPMRHQPLQAWQHIHLLDERQKDQQQSCVN